MKQRPDTAGLLRLAAAVLGKFPLPDDKQDYSYEQRMALKALSIAASGREHGAADMAEEIELFIALYGKEAVKPVGDDDAARVAALNMVLATDIRVGMWDEAPPALWNLLMALTRARLRRVNPKYLKARENSAD